MMTEKGNVLPSLAFVLELGSIPMLDLYVEKGKSIDDIGNG